jgi:alpha-tubulin suppressor-like RCC1 family protein
METLICPHCGNEHPLGTRFCPRNGLAIISSGNSICPSCGKAIEATWKVCAYCGKALTSNDFDATVKTKSPISRTRKTEPFLVISFIILIFIVIAGFGIFTLVRSQKENLENISSVETEPNILNETLTPPNKTNLIALGAAHTCAITNTGGVKCWGDNESGQIGDGTTANRPTPTDVIGLSSGAIAISAGWSYTCAVMSDGGVKCWGDNKYGQLGDGTTTNRTTPVDVIGLNSSAIAIAAGNDHTCALTSEGGVKCWGDNWMGQLGDNTTDRRLMPVDVYGLISGVSFLAVGAQHSCALVNANKVKCWGANIHGELGDGTTTTMKNSVGSLIPVDVINLGSNVVALALGQFHTCALTSEGEVKCWGDNRYGQLGDGKITAHITPANVSGVDAGVIAIGAGRFHNCVLTDGVKCWGWNKEGQLGDNTTTDRSTPVNVTGLNGDIAALAVGGHHTCVLIDKGGIKCWGWNFSGQLGNGQMVDSNTPITDIYSNDTVDVIDSEKWFH